MENWQSLGHRVEKVSVIKKFNFPAFLVEPICYYLTVSTGPLNTPGILLLSARLNFLSYPYGPYIHFSCQLAFLNKTGDVTRV